MITHAQLLDLLSYDPDTGLFTLKVGTRNRKAGSVMNVDGFVQRHENSQKTRRSWIFVTGFHNYFAGRLAWFYMTGGWPEHEIDHWDNDGWNQRWTNLRPASRSQNQANTRRYQSNSSGKKGVFRSGSKHRPWRAQVQKDKRRISLGRFETKKAAFAAYAAAALACHGDFARLA